MAGPAETVAWGRLTLREREIIDRILRRETIKEIAHAIGRSPKTAELHVRNVLWKTGMSSRKELVARAGVVGDLGIVEVDRARRRKL